MCGSRRVSEGEVDPAAVAGGVLALTTVATNAGRALALTTVDTTAGCVLALTTVDTTATRLPRPLRSLHLTGI